MRESSSQQPAWEREHQQPRRPAAAVSSSIGDQRPNVVMILTDDMRTSDLRYMPKTRRLIGQRGVSFDRSISPHPLCCPARAELLSAQFAQNNHVYTNRPPLGAYHAFDRKRTIAVRMQRTGYRTGFIGKHLNQYGSHKSRPARRDPGWDVWDPIVSGVYTYNNARFYGSEPAPGSYVTNEITNRALSAIKQFDGPGQPFYLQVDHLAPHSRFNDLGEEPPLVEPRYAGEFSGERNPSAQQPNYLERNLSDKPRNLRTVKRTFDPGSLQGLFLARIRALQSVDAGVQRVVQALKAAGEYDNTYIIFTSDNGFALGEHQFVGKNRLTSEVLRVPLMISGPGIAARSHNRNIVTTVDTATTILQLTRSLPVDLTKIDGISYAQHGFRGGRWRTSTLVQVAKAARRTTDVRKVWDMRGVVTNRYTFAARPGHRGIVMLFDHQRDPWELRNVAGTRRYAEVERRLARTTRELSTCAGVVACNPLSRPLRRSGARPQKFRAEQPQRRRGTRGSPARRGPRAPGTR